MAVETDDCKFVSQLDEKGREIAKTELNELNGKDRELAVQTFRQWVLEQKWLKTPTDFEFLLRFLRVRKFSQLEARKSIENYWTCKTLYPNWFKDVDPADEAILAVLKSGFIISPKKYDKCGRRLLIWPHGNPDSKLISKFGIDNVYKATCCALDWLATDEKVQVNGVATFCDQSDLDYMVMTKFWTPSTAKAFLHFFQKALPVRYKTIAIHNESTFLDLILTIGKPFMAEKFRNRIKTYGKSMVKLYDEWGKESFAQEYLPDDYTGPGLGNISEIIDDMIKEMLDPKFRNYIKELSSGKYGVDTKVRQQNTEAEVASFRKLNIE